jgi:hypothetical protein
VAFNLLYQLIHSVVYLTTGPPLPKWVLQKVRSSATSFNFQYPLFSLRSSSSCLRFLLRLPVTYILPSIFPSITCFRRQFLRKMRPIQLAFLLFIVCTIFLPWLYVILNSSHDRYNWSSPSLIYVSRQTFLDWEQCNKFRLTFKLNKLNQLMHKLSHLYCSVLIICPYI